MAEAHTTMRVLVVDDEPPARQRLIDLLQQDPHIGQISEAANGLAAIAQIETERPDLVLLDVQMPELDGLGVVAAIGAAQMPLTVFVTAYDQHALRAFEANAMDYLLKPFGDERLFAMLERAKQRLREQRGSALAQDLQQLLQTLPRKSAQRLLIRSTGSAQWLDVAQIEWIEGAGVYVNLHMSGRSVLHRSSLSALENELDPAQFVRIHRSAMVRLACVTGIETLSHGECLLQLVSGARVRVSRSYRAALEQRLAGK